MCRGHQEPRPPELGGVEPLARVPNSSRGCRARHTHDTKIAAVTLNLGFVSNKKNQTFLPTLCPRITPACFFASSSHTERYGPTVIRASLTVQSLDGGTKVKLLAFGCRWSRVSVVAGNGGAGSRASGSGAEHGR